MTSAEGENQIFHITHMKNLSGILGEGGLWCDRQRIEKNLVSTNIGYSHIKDRRMARSVPTRGGGTLGDYVPFNFCPRSVMLYPVATGHVNYEGGQESVIHLMSTVNAATLTGAAWAFTDRHADLVYAHFYEDISQLHNVPWQVMGQRYWQTVKEERQAEFLVRDFFPWSAVLGIAVISEPVAAQVSNLLGSTSIVPPISVRPEWYY